MQTCLHFICRPGMYTLCAGIITFVDHHHLQSSLHLLRIRAALHRLSVLHHIRNYLCMIVSRAPVISCQTMLFHIGPHASCIPSTRFDANAHSPKTLLQHLLWTRFNFKFPFPFILASLAATESDATPGLCRQNAGALLRRATSSCLTASASLQVDILRMHSGQQHGRCSGCGARSSR